MFVKEKQNRFLGIFSFFKEKIPMVLICEDVVNSKEILPMKI